jgi:hypothetical protein
LLLRDLCATSYPPRRLCHHPFAMRKIVQVPRRSRTRFACLIK